MEIPAPTSARRGFGTARPSSDADPIAEMAHEDTPEIVPTFALPARQEVHRDNPQFNPNPPFHVTFDVSAEQQVDCVLGVDCSSNLRC